MKMAVVGSTYLGTGGLARESRTDVFVRVDTVINPLTSTSTAADPLLSCLKYLRPWPYPKASISLRELNGVISVLSLP